MNISNTPSSKFPNPNFSGGFEYFNNAPVAGNSHSATMLSGTSLRHFTFTHLYFSAAIEQVDNSARNIDYISLLILITGNAGIQSSDPITGGAMAANNSRVQSLYLRSRQGFISEKIRIPISPNTQIGFAFTLRAASSIVVTDNITCDLFYNWE